MTATSVLLRWARRRWRGRADFEYFPPIQRWRAIEPGFLDGAECRPERLIRAAVTGYVSSETGFEHRLSDAVTLLSGCPAMVQATELPDTGHGPLSASPRRAILISIYSLAADDLLLAEDIITSCAAVGAFSLVERFSRWLSLPPNAPRCGETGAPSETRARPGSRSGNEGAARRGAGEAVVDHVCHRC
ncbi:hypothetical protein [Nocardia miyunensis]|uniref:hypothetical protein n=1 Tax=Nocardia miyunensis TaxID=282684 RepID=UPI0012F4D97F|nr:hypothetical protein [Nocardia miyunensis]